MESSAYRLSSGYSEASQQCDIKSRLRLHPTMQIIPVKKAYQFGLLASVLAIMLLAGCSSTSRGLLMSETERAAQERVEQYLTRCGDSYVAGIVRWDGRLYPHQWKPAKILLYP